MAAVDRIAVEEQRWRTWNNSTELLAQTVDLLGHIAARLDAGIGVVTLKKTGTPSKVTPVTRPDWVPTTPTAGSGERVVTAKEFFGMMRR